MKTSHLVGLSAVVCMLLPGAAGGGLLFAGVRQSADGKSWTLDSGAVELTLQRQDKALGLKYFGRAGGTAWEPGNIFWARVGGHDIGSFQTELLSASVQDDELRLRLKDDTLPLEIEVVYSAAGRTGVFTRRVTLFNRGASPLAVDAAPSLSLSLPAADYELTYLWGTWGQELQVATEKLNPGRRSFGSRRGRSSDGFAPWFGLHDPGRNIWYAAQLAWSGNWEMNIERPALAAPPASTGLDLDLGMRFDNGRLSLAPGSSFELPPAAFTASGGSLDDAANQLHHYQRQFVFPSSNPNRPLLVQFNSWYPFPGKMTVAEMKQSATLAAELGAEVFVLDAGWYNKKDWSKELGDYQADPVAFPHGLRELADFVRSRGMKFGLWVEIENIGVESDMFREHSAWCLARDGRPVVSNKRCQLDFGRLEVRQWARSVLDRLMRDCSLDWLKIDYNISVGDDFAPGDGAALYRHVRNYYAWLDELRAAYPKLIIENCSSGGLRFDTGIMAHTHTTWLSDEVLPKPSVQLAYGCTLEFAPEVCNHWMVGDDNSGLVKPDSLAGWEDFLLRVPMNGQFGISSKISRWPAQLRQRAAENVALYKHIRALVATADVYHLTPPPTHKDPSGWMALEYVSADRRHAVVTAYRLTGPARQSLLLHGLDSACRYHVNGQTRTGQELMTGGLELNFDAEWRAGVIEIQAE